MLFVCVGMDTRSNSWHRWPWWHRQARWTVWCLLGAAHVSSRHSTPPLGPSPVHWEPPAAVRRRPPPPLPPGDTQICVSWVHLHMPAG